MLSSVVRAGGLLRWSCTGKRRGVFMYQLIENQVLGIDGWVNVSNIVFLVAFSTRDVLVLRILALVGEGLILPYYYLQAETLWQPIFWSLAFMAVNAVRIVATVLERRPVILSEKEEQLYRVAFSSVDKREFLKLASLARWVDCSAGEVILEKGHPVCDAIVLISGEMEAILGGKSRMALRPGQLVGDGSAYSGLASPVDIVARSRAKSCQMGPAAPHGVHGQQTGSPRQTFEHCERGPCRQTDRRSFGSRGREHCTGTTGGRRITRALLEEIPLAVPHCNVKDGGP